MLWVEVYSGAEGSVMFNTILSLLSARCRSKPSSGRIQETARKNGEHGVLSCLPDGFQEACLDLGSCVREIVYYSFIVDPVIEVICVGFCPLQFLTKTSSELEPHFLMNPGKRNTVSVMKAEAMYCSTQDCWFWRHRKPRRTQGLSSGIHLLQWPWSWPCSMQHCVNTPYVAFTQ